MVTRVCYTSCLTTNEAQHNWMAHMNHLTSLDLSYRYLSNSTGGVIIWVSVCPRGLFLSFFIFLCLSSLFILNYASLFLEFKRAAYDTYDSRVADVICNSLNCAIFLNILCTLLFYPFKKSAKNKKKNHFYSYFLKKETEALPHQLTKNTKTR
jgi:ABC-type spermidine/putrescine transport system permease subunit I